MSRQLTTEEFIEKAIKIHGNKYDYSKVNYINGRNKVTIICTTHGEFEQTSRIHMEGSRCPKCVKDIEKENRTKTTEQFIKDAISLHGNKYDYSLTEYENNNTKITIICPEHGEFNQTPRGHLEGKGCMKCRNKRISEVHTKTNQEFIEECIKVHGDRYSYEKTKYESVRKKVVITCPIHGDFEQRPDGHLEGKRCSKCVAIERGLKNTKTTNEFIKDAIIIFGDTYDYSITNYKNSKEKITIICKIHGHFEQSPNTHLQGQGCKKCGQESWWSRSDYIKKANGRICTFYTIRCFNEEESFYKIGITMNSVKKRYANIVSMPYNYEIVSEVFGEAGVIWDTEKEEKRKLKEFHYLPEIYFSGSKTECFTQYKI